MESDPFVAPLLRMTRKSTFAGAPTPPLVLYPGRQNFNSTGSVMPFRHALCAVLAAASGFPVLRAQSAATLPRRLGITAGLNSATVGGGEVGDASRRTGFIVGATMVAPMSPSVSLEPQVLFTSKGAHFEDSSGGGSITMNYIQVPLLVRVRGSSSGRSEMHPFVFGGPAIALKASCNVEATDGSVRASFSCDQLEEGDVKFNSVDYGVIVGAGLGFNVGGRMFSIGARYDHSLADIDDASGVKHRVISIMATLEFPWMK